MPEAHTYTVDARVISIEQQDLSKTAGKPNIYSIIELEILKATPKVPGSPALAPTRVNLRRPAVPEDASLQPGTEIGLELGVDDPASPKYYYWLKRLR